MKGKKKPAKKSTAWCIPSTKSEFASEFSHSLECVPAAGLRKPRKPR